MADRALFLDRDGVINIDKGYVYRIEDFEFIDGIFELGQRAITLGYRIFVVTNQAGIGRGYYTEADFRSLTDWMLRQFAAAGVEIAKVYHCPSHPQQGVGQYRRESFFRKPNPGMLLAARDEFSLDLSRSALVGDKVSDIQAGTAAGVGLNVLLSRGEPRCALDAELKNVLQVTDLRQVSELLPSEA